MNNRARDIEGGKDLTVLILDDRSANWDWLIQISRC